MVRWNRWRSTTHRPGPPRSRQAAGGPPRAWLGHGGRIRLPGGFAVSLDEPPDPSICCSTWIAKHKPEVTELALHQVTDDYIAWHPSPGVVNGIR